MRGGDGTDGQNPGELVDGAGTGHPDEPREGALRVRGSGMTPPPVGLDAASRRRVRVGRLTGALTGGAGDRFIHVG